MNDTLGLVSNHVESDRLGKRTALSNGNNVSFLDRESRRAVGSNIGVTLLETTVLLNVMQVITSDNNGSSHLGGDDNTLHDGTTDGHISGKRALFVDIVSLNGGHGRLDTKTHALDKAHGLVALVANGTLASHENGILLLVRLFVLVALGIYLCDTVGLKRHLS